MPIIAFTASVTKVEIYRCEEAGMNAVVPKPFKESELLSALHAVVGKKEEATSPGLTTSGRGADTPAASSRIAPDDSGPADKTIKTLVEKAAVGSVSSVAGLEFLEELTGGNQLRIRKYLGLYLASVQSAIPKIEAALAANHGEDLRRTVHTLKPQLKMVGLMPAAELAADIESRLI